MFVRQGGQELINNVDFIFHLRKCEHSKYWWPALAANQDSEFIKTIAKTGGARIYASQIEGSMYPLSVLLEIKKIISDNRLLSSTLFYDRAEFYFSSIASAMGYTPGADPIVFAEFHRFDSNIWRVFFDFAIRPSLYLWLN